MAESRAPKRNRTLELNKALSVLGFGTWNNLEPEVDKNKNDEGSAPSATSVVDKLNKAMFSKLQEIEAKREKAAAFERKLSKMAEGSKKKQLTYQKQQEEAMAIKYKRTPIDEERALHEAYQILLRECEYRRARNEKMANENGRLRLGSNVEDEPTPAPVEKSEPKDPEPEETELEPKPTPKSGTKSRKHKKKDKKPPEASPISTDEFRAAESFLSFEFQAGGEF